MENTRRNAKTWALAGLFKRINRGDDPNLLRKEACQLAKDIGPEDIVAAEQSLIDDGYSNRLVKQLSATFMLMELHDELGENSNGRLPDNHILRKIVAEHDLARCFLADLNDVVDDILSLDRLTDTCSEFRRLVHCVGHLSVMKEHIDREEDVIFPYLNKYGWMALCQTAQTDHANIRTDIDGLVALIISFNKVQFDGFKAWLATIVRRLSPIMLEHLSYEDDLLCPVALVIIDDVKVWETIKALCEDIGYCGAHA
ncbi:MAG: DUF438 domain-containing protein [Planctomycetota bacterium]|jgi:DUF438 domain-containing protein